MPHERRRIRAQEVCSGQSEAPGPGPANHPAEALQSIRTEESYVGWIRKFILFHGKRHPAEMKEGEVVAFLSHLANQASVTASTQNQDFSALLFVYGHVHKQNFWKRATIFERYRNCWDTKP
jgi:hypothetical protein